MSCTILHNPALPLPRLIRTQTARKSAPSISRPFQGLPSVTPSTSDKDSIVHLTAQPPVSGPLSLDMSLRIAIDSVSAVELRGAIIELGNDVPEIAEELIQLLSTPAPGRLPKRSLSEALAPLPVTEKSKTRHDEVVEEQKLKQVCENCLIKR